MNNEERIHGYYDGSLSEEDREKLIQDLAQDPELKKEWELYGKIIEGIKSEGEAELREYIISRVKRKENISEGNLWMYAAASVALLLTGYFVIYSLMSTKSIEEATEIITLKDEKSKGLRFWEKEKKTLEPKPTSEPRSPYIDSLRYLEKSIAKSDSSTNSIQPLDSNELNTYAMSGVAPMEDSESPQMAESLTENSSLIPVKDQADLAAPAVLSAKSSRIKKSAVDPIDPIDTLEQTLIVGIYVKPIQLSLEQEIKNRLISTDQKEIQLEKKPLVPVKRVHINHYENNLNKVLANVKRDQSEVQIDLFNVWGENPLVYAIQNDYYLDLGNKRIWKIPRTNSKQIELTWEENEDIIKVITNE